MGVTLCWGRVGVRGAFPLSGEGVAGMTCELTAASIHCASEGGGEREFGSEFESQKRGDEGKMFLRFSLYFFFILFWVDWQQIQPISPCQIWFAHGNEC